MALTADQIGPTIQPYINNAFDIGWIIAQLILIAAVLVYFILVMRFNIKVNIHEFTKGSKTIIHQTRAREFIDRKSNIPKIQLFGIMGFGGQVINQPPSECITPFKGISAKKMYMYIKKDGLFFPIQNLVLGRRFEIPNIAANEEQARKIEAAHAVADEMRAFEVKDDKNKRVIYTLDDSGLEVTRDYEAEQAVENILIAKAEALRNSKPSVLYAMYGLSIILAIGSFVTLVYSWHQFGNMAGAIASLQEPLRAGTEAAINQRLGP